MNFTLIMFVALLVTGAVALLDRWVLAKRRLPAQDVPAQGMAATATITAPAEPWFIEFCKSLFPVILVVFLIRSFVVEPFKIPSGSMIPTLLVGDFLLVNKYTYGLRVPLTSIKMTDGNAVKRGDVVVFRFPNDPSVDYIKRVVGLPGDTVTYIDKQVFINGKPIQSDYLNDYNYVSEDGRVLNARRYQEDLSGRRHDAIVVPDQARLDMSTVKVPAGHYFVMGDNRDNSNDSRFWGFVPDANLVGEAMLIWWSWDGQDFRVRWSRMGDHIQ